ncbi:hypothetical protein QKT49_gp338 [Acanthamoeba castellanii medusavirus]|uniref:Uncharacterized protein n=1 Tax=Acanthamoeba castellanii medusavirus J1 TaxID=3114988 RepID=A0A3T1CXA7_9VIRU|nr:hypothetical protein QKT49_gp338 [Acanthamoeba castellanii medusavirus]BBI30425.1 hypothetical protein [Acanthamoeba castellanii medusavirus J1]
MADDYTKRTDSTPALVSHILSCAHKGHMEHVEAAIADHRERLTGICLESLSDCCNAASAGIAYVDLMAGLEWTIAERHMEKVLDHVAEFCKSEEEIEFVLWTSTLFQSRNGTRRFWDEVACASGYYENEAMYRVACIRNG